MEFKFNNVTERDMDMLFLEEFAVNKKFLRLFTKLVKEENLYTYEVVSGEISCMDTVLGESDLTIILEKNSCKVGLLIEDKINAIAQPRQYERYLERGNKAVKEKIFDRFYVFLIAPDEYFKSVVGNEYPRRVRYEACQKLFEGKTDARSQLKYRQITKAIEFGHKPYTKIVDEKSTAFWDSYVHYMHIHYPDIDLKSKVREKSKGGDWPTYRTSLDMNTVYIHHKMKMKDVEYSNIDLTFNGLAEHREELKELLQRMLGDKYDSQFGIHKAGKSAVLRLVAPKYLDWQKPFEDQKDIVEVHLSMVDRLRKAASYIDKKRLLEFYESVRKRNH